MILPTPIGIKICGVTSIKQAKEIAHLGADAIGVIGVESSSRFVPEEKRRKIFSQLAISSPNLHRVWVVADQEEHFLDQGLIGQGTPSVIQLHGQESPEKCSSLRKKNPKMQWWKALRISSEEDLNLISHYSDSVDAVLLDAWVPGKLGGTGKRIPLEWLSNQKINHPWWLAGGISAEWIPKLISKVKPSGIDASSSLEIAPGIKDLEKVESLIDSIKTTRFN